MKAKLVKGTRDFLPSDIRKRDIIFSNLKEIFELYGFQPLETPAMEQLDTLTGKYGDEGDQLLFKILNNGDYLKKADQTALQQKNSKGLLSSISSRALRYDLTVPFARFVASNHTQLPIPFKRYQIQPVWRADRPQKGRYREFYQCDVDVIGSDSLIQEAELCQMYDMAFARLGIDVIIRLNHRKVLSSLANLCQLSDQFMSMVTIIDKLDKIGWDAVCEQLVGIGMQHEAIELVRKVIYSQSIDDIKNLLTDADGIDAQKDLQQVLDYLKGYTFTNTLQIDFGLARGLSYYTGCIFEVIVNTQNDHQANIKMGSIGGGGRYDELTAIFGVKGLSGVGVSFGAERIFDVMNELQLFDQTTTSASSLLILTMDETSFNKGIDLATLFRSNKINTDIYPTYGKFQKLMKYANKSGNRHVLIIGSQEVEEEKYTLKEMHTGDQQKLTSKEIIQFFCD